MVYGLGEYKTSPILELPKTWGLATFYTLKDPDSEHSGLPENMESSELRQHRRGASSSEEVKEVNSIDLWQGPVSFGLQEYYPAILCYFISV